MGEQCLGVVQGWLWGKEWQGVWESVVSGESQLLYPPHSFRHTRSWSPGASATFLTYSKFSAQGREHVSCLSLSGQDKGGGGEGVFPGPQQSGPGQPLLVAITAGLQPDPESVFIPTP